MRYITTATIKKTINIPLHTPALNMSPIPWQPDKKVLAKSRKEAVKKINFICKFYLRLM